jgi:membrane protein
MKTYYKIYKESLVSAVNHDGFEFAGYMAFLGILAVFPFMVFLFAIAGFLGNLEIGREFVIELNHVLPQEIIQGLMPRINEILNGPPQGLLTLAIIGTIWTASSIFEGLRTSLNRAYRVKDAPSYIFRRLMSFLEFIITTLVVITITFLLTVVPEFFKIIVKKFELMGNTEMTVEDEFRSLRLFVSGIIFFLMLISSYVLIPNANIRFRAVMPGSITVMVLWIMALSIYSYYLSSFHQMSLVYGSLAGIIATMLFFYIMSFIYIFGAEINYFWHKYRNVSN